MKKLPYQYSSSFDPIQTDDVAFLNKLKRLSKNFVSSCKQNLPVIQDHEYDPEVEYDPKLDPDNAMYIGDQQNSYRYDMILSELDCYLILHQLSLYSAFDIGYQYQFVMQSKPPGNCTSFPC